MMQADLSGRAATRGRGHRPAALLAMLWALATPVQAADAWLGTDAQDGGTHRCVIQSVAQTVDDGYQETPVRLELDRATLRVITESNLDLTLGPLGLVVDDGVFIAADRVEHDTSLVFEKPIDAITRAFVAGSRARLTLRFWPTWPATGDKTVEISLAGFTRALHTLSACG